MNPVVLICYIHKQHKFSFKQTNTTDYSMMWSISETRRHNTKQLFEKLTNGWYNQLTCSMQIKKKYQKNLKYTIGTQFIS